MVEEEEEDEDEEWADGGEDRGGKRDSITVQPAKLGKRDIPKHLLDLNGL